MKIVLGVFSALSDETRLRIMKLLEGGELCICKIVEILEMKQSRISHHMGILKNAGLVADRRDGKWVHYSVNPRPESLSCKEINAFLRKCLIDHEVVLSDQRKLKQLLEKERKGLWRPTRHCSIPEAR